MNTMNLQKIELDVLGLEECVTRTHKIAVTIGMMAQSFDIDDDVQSAISLMADYLFSLDDELSEKWNNLLNTVREMSKEENGSDDPE